MSTKTATPTIEDSIKTALDAADTAITVTGEFDKIRTDYDLTRAEVKTVNAQIRTVFFSALAASVLAIVVSGLMYFRTLSEMQTANETALEGLVIFAENVDKLTAATTSLQAHESTIGSLIDKLTALQEITEKSTVNVSAEQAAIRKDIADTSAEALGLIGQSTRAMLDDLTATLQDNQGKLETKLTELTGKIGQGTSEPQNQQAEVSKVTLNEINANLETIMMLQKEISAKLTVAKPPVKQTAPRPTTVKKKPQDNPIKFP